MNDSIWPYIVGLLLGVVMPLSLFIPVAIVVIWGLYRMEKRSKIIPR